MLIRTRLRVSAFVLAGTAALIIVIGIFLYLRLADSRQHEQVLQDVISESGILVQLRQEYEVTGDQSIVLEWTKQWEFIDHVVRNSEEHFLHEPEHRFFSEFYALHVERKTLFEALVLARAKDDSAEVARLIHSLDHIQGEQVMIFSALSELSYREHSQARSAYDLLVIIAATIMSLISPILLFASQRVFAGLFVLQRECANIITDGAATSSSWHKISDLSDARDEVGLLASAFVHMGEEVRRYRDRMEELVAKRTEDLRLEKEGVERKVIERTKEATEAKEKIEKLIESMGDGVIAIDRAGTVVLWNRVAGELSGWTREEAMGRPFGDVLRIICEKNRKKNCDFILKAMVEKKTKNLIEPTLLIRKDGRELPIGDSAAPLIDANGECFGAIIVFRDVTIERKLERVKDEFVSLASHELRTPLTVIRTYTDMLLAGDGGPLAPLQKEFTIEASRANMRMLALVDAFLNVSRIDLGVFAIAPSLVDLGAIAQDEVGSLKHQIQTRHLRCDVHVDASLPRMNMDPKLIGIVFHNLLSNAVKYTPEGGAVTLDIKKDKGNVCMSLTDTGIGIPKKEQKKIFTKLFRTDNARAMDPDGTGLGLYIVKAIVEESGGKIWFESKENVGTTFYITLPLRGMKEREGTKGLA